LRPYNLDRAIIGTRGPKYHAQGLLVLL